VDLAKADELEATKPHEEEERPLVMINDTATAFSKRDGVGLAPSASIHTT
jgi:hypothetical protein